MEATFHGLTTNHAGERMNLGGGMEITGPVLFAAQPPLWCAGCEPVAAEAEAAPVAAGADDPGVSGHINPALRAADLSFAVLLPAFGAMSWTLAQVHAIVVSCVCVVFCASA